MEENNNPYAAPKAEIDERPISSKPVPATKVRRLVNYLIDTVIHMVLAIAFVVIAIAVYGEGIVADIEGINDFVLGAVVVFVYYTILEGIFGRSIGKWITGTKVVNENGQPASFLQVVGRSLLRLIPFEAFSFLVSEGRGWHDSLAKTYVVSSR